MKIALGADHGGFELKEEIISYLKDNGYDVEDYGTYSKESCDYPDYALKAAEAVASKECDLGILICGTGIGMSIAANKFKGIRAAVVSDCFSAKATREHNNTNVLCLGERVIGKGLAMRIVEEWLNSSYNGERHARRLQMIDDIEKENL